MAGSVFVSLREQIVGRVNDLLADEHEACADSQNLLGYLIGALINYPDEGIAFSPAIVFCDDIDRVLRSFPGSVYYTIGTAPLGPSSGPRILKECAPLSGENWFVFIKRIDKKTIEYGVFTYFRLPTAIPLHEGISIDEAAFCLLVRKLDANSVEIRGSRGNVLTADFSTLRSRSDIEDNIINFSDNCCKDIRRSCT